MKPVRRSVHDGGRERCIACGHPRKEHPVGIDGCTVPKCRCVRYAQATAPGRPAEPSRVAPGA